MSVLPVQYLLAEVVDRPGYHPAIVTKVLVEPCFVAFRVVVALRRVL